MVQRLFSQHFDYGEGLAAFSALEAGGFHPNFENYHYATLAMIEMEALGGLKINLPEQEVNDAHEWLSFLRDNPITDFDVIERPQFGKAGRGIILSSLNPLALFPWLPVLFLPLALLWIATIVAIIVFSLIDHNGLGIYPVLLFFPAMLTHAQYVAGPKFVRPRDVPIRSL